MVAYQATWITLRTWNQIWDYPRKRKVAGAAMNQPLPEVPLCQITINNFIY